MGIEPTLPEPSPGVLSQLNYGNIRQTAQGCCVVCGRGSAPKTAHGVFRQRQMGKWRDRTEALHAGNRTRSAGVFHQTLRPPILRRITDQLRPIENRVRPDVFAMTTVQAFAIAIMMDKCICLNYHSLANRYVQTRHKTRKFRRRIPGSRKSAAPPDSRLQNLYEHARL